MADLTGPADLAVRRNADGTQLVVIPELHARDAESARSATACVANDSGSGHLFAESAGPLICLIGPSAPEKFAPRTDRLTIVRAQDFDSTEMRAIPVEAVEQAVRAAVS